jgi:hypothetical protein
MLITEKTYTGLTEKIKYPADHKLRMPQADVCDGIVRAVFKADVMVSMVILPPSQIVD